MSREIKFAFWHNQKKEMWGVDSIDWRLKEVCNGGDIASLDDGILLQYTGLKDNNDKEICEGDIIHFSKYNQKHNELDQGIGIVKFDEFDYLYGLRLEDCKQIKPKPSGFFRGLGDLGSCEIIGNIYENPELMGGKNG